MSPTAAAGEYSVPTYKAAAGATWYHFLHGNVPGHQIDFMYRAEVPQGPLSPQHFSHLARLMKYIEPRAGSPFAFAIGNLSRDDTQHEPGHGGLGLILGFRVKGATDHAGRRDPPFAHGIAAVDRQLDFASIFQASIAFCRRVLGEPDEGDSRALAEMYARYVAAGPGGRAEVIRGYLGPFGGLPRVERSKLTGRWVSRGAPPAKRIVITHADDAPFHEIAWCAARLAAVLYQSNVRWTAITTGRESEIANGISVKFVPRREAGVPEAETLVLPIEEVPEEEGELASRLFGAEPLEAPQGPVFAVWAEHAGPRVSSEPVEPPAAPRVERAPDARLNGGGSGLWRAEGAWGKSPEPLEEQVARIRKPRRTVWLALVLLGGAGIAMGFFTLRSASGAGDSMAPANSPGGEVGAPERAMELPGPGRNQEKGVGGEANRQAPAMESVTPSEESAKRDPRSQMGSNMSGDRAGQRDRGAQTPRGSGVPGSPFGGVRPTWRP